MRQRFDEFIGFDVELLNTGKNLGEVKVKIGFWWLLALLVQRKLIS